MSGATPSPPASLPTPHGHLPLPVFLPDATFGAVRGVDAADLERIGVPGLVMNVFHLMQKPGSSTIRALGGLHRMAGWSHPIVTDSGGFQAYSLIRQNPAAGRLSERGILFQPEGAGRKFRLSPEKSVQLQLAYGADVVICLDDCTHPDAPFSAQAESVARTVAWAARCKAEFRRQLESRRGDGRRPLLFGVVQGGRDPSLRRQCAERLLEIGFDGYGYGGWPLDADNRLLEETLALTRALIPPSFPMHALGVGRPDYIVACARLGYALFDSALPTRDARRGRLYIFAADPANPAFTLSGDWYTTLYIADRKHIKTARPLSPTCDCPTCARYSTGYLHHLFKTAPPLYIRLATLHNLRFLVRLMGLLAKQNPPGEER